MDFESTQWAVQYCNAFNSADEWRVILGSFVRANRRVHCARAVISGVGWAEAIVITVGRVFDSKEDEINLHWKNDCNKCLKSLYYALRVTFKREFQSDAAPFIFVYLRNIS